MKPHNSPPKFRILFKSLAALGLLTACTSMQAAPLTQWTQSFGTNASNLSSSSPVFGNGTAGSANSQRIWAAAPSEYTLTSVGDMISFSGSVTFNVSTSLASDQFRFGLYDSNGQSGTDGWLGYMASNSGTGGNPNGRLWERNAGNTTTYADNGVASATQRQAPGGTPSNSFAAGTYDFSLSATRTASGLNVTWSILGTGSTIYSIGGTYVDTTPLTYTFDRVGLVTVGGASIAQVNFSNVDLTAVPEPHSMALLAGSALILGAFGRRRRLGKA